MAIEIERDLTQPHPMQRLLQGDVGSGKTIVACMAALQSIESGWQVALMAPTEILAEQHFRKMLGWLTPLNIKIAWLTGSQNKKTAKPPCKPLPMVAHNSWLARTRFFKKLCNLKTRLSDY